MTQGTFEFLIEVGDRVPDGYRLTCAYPDPDSPTGTGGHSTVAPLNPADPALSAQLATLPTMVLASAARSRLAVSPMEAAARTVGDHLFRALTGGETLGELARLRRRAQAAGADVRVALRIRPPELAALPWEFLFDAREDRREFLGRSCMVTRSAGDLRTVPPLTVAGPLRVLALAASPGDQAELDVERERRYLEAALAPMFADGRLELAWVPATKQELLSATQRQRWHIVHYIGHGDFDAAGGSGRLAFAADDGSGTDWVTARQLATILGPHPTLRLVLLNACQSSAGSAEDGQAGLAAALVHAGLAAVVAMQFPITDDAAPVFGREFYGALAAGEPVDRCVRAGRAAITLANDASLEWGTPVLHLRSADGALFAVEAAGLATSGSAPVGAAPAELQTSGAVGADLGAETVVMEHIAEPWHTADPPTESEPWRPEPEPSPAQPLGADRAARLQQLGMDLMAAADQVLNRRYSVALVEELERIVEAYTVLNGPEHPSTVTARKALINARAGEAAVDEAQPELPVQAPVVEDEDSEDQFRSKTTRRTGGERQPRAPRSSKAVVATGAGDIEVGGEVQCLAFTAGDSRLLGIGTADGPAYLVDPDAGNKRLEHGDVPVRQIVFQPGGELVACLLGRGDRPDRVQIWRAGGEPAGAVGPASHFAFHPEPGLFVAGSGGSDLSLRRVEAPVTPVTRYRGFAELGDVAVSPTGRLVAAIGDHEIRVWVTLTGEQVAVFDAPESRLELGLQFAPDGSVLFASHTQHGLIRCDLATGRSTPCVPAALGAQRPVWSLAPDGLAIGMPFYGASSAADFWDVAWPDFDLGRLPDQIHPSVRPAFGPSGNLLAVALPDRRTVRRYTLAR